MNDLLSVQQVAERLHISKDTVYKLIRTGKLKAFKPTGGKTCPWLITEQSLTKYVKAKLREYDPEEKP